MRVVQCSKRAVHGVAVVARQRSVFVSLVRRFVLLNCLYASLIGHFASPLSSLLFLQLVFLFIVLLFFCFLFFNAIIYIFFLLAELTKAASKSESGLSLPVGPIVGVVLCCILFICSSTIYVYLVCNKKHRKQNCIANLK